MDDVGVKVGLHGLGITPDMLTSKLPANCRRAEAKTWGNIEREVDPAPVSWCGYRLARSFDGCHRKLASPKSSSCEAHVKVRQISEDI